MEFTSGFLGTLYINGYYSSLGSLHAWGDPNSSMKSLDSNVGSMFVTTEVDSEFSFLCFVQKVLHLIYRFVLHRDYDMAREI